jgi:hypothetical protein
VLLKFKHFFRKVVTSLPENTASHCGRQNIKYLARCTKGWAKSIHVGVVVTNFKNNGIVYKNFTSVKKRAVEKGV